MIRFIRRHVPPSIRAQMTIFYTTIFAFLLLIILVVSYGLIHLSASQESFTTIDTMANAIAQRVSYQQGIICVQPTMPSLPGAQTSLPLCKTTTHTAVLPLTINAAALLRIYDVQQHLVYQSPAFAALQVEPKIVSASLEGYVLRETMTTNAGQTVIFLSVALVDQRHIFAVLQVALPTTIPSHGDLGLGVFFLLLYPVLVILGGFGSYALATRAFRPIRRMTEAARAIQSGDLHQRVPVPISKDDIHTLALSFNEMTEKLDAAFTQQRRFVADASHELRTPVAVIRNMTDVALAHEASPEEYQTVLREVNSEAERLGRLINTLLGLARADDDRLMQDRELVRLNLLVADVVESVAPLAAERGIMLAARRLDEVQVSGDTAQLIQIIMCLVDNAINYTPTGGIVNLSVVAQEKTASVVVSDTGIGIGPKDLPHIFERFYRADPARSRVAGGSGLGLALAQEFARAHNSTITVLSRVGQGSSFTFTLPRA